jgi:hypothetical protein
MVSERVGLVVCGILIALALGASAPARGDGIDWQQRVSLRADGEGNALVPIDPEEHRHRKVSRDLDYVTLHIETLYLHGLPGFRSGAPAILGVEADGVLRGGETLKTVSEVQRCQGKRCRLHFDELSLVRPFVYGGGEVTLRLFVRALADDEAKSARGKVSAVGDLVAKIDPHARSAIENVARVFESVLGASTGSVASWKHSLTLVPADQVIDASPESLFTAARHVFLFLPPADAPAGQKRIRPKDVLGQLKMQGRRLVWKADEREYTETAYLVFTVRRYRRYPGDESPMRRLRAAIEKAFANDNFDHALVTLREIQAALAQDIRMTVSERNLERAWLDDWRLRISAARAALRNDTAQELADVARQVIGLHRIEARFRDVLEATERKQIEHRRNTLRDRLQVLSKAAGGVPAELASAIAQAQSLPSAPAELPAGPLHAQIWTDKREYRAGENMRIFLRGNRPFFARVVYRDASGRLVQLLPNPDRKQNYFEANRVYEIPAAGDRFAMEVSPPFGDESLFLYASTTPLGDLELEAVEDGIYVVKTPAAQIDVKTRGIRLKRKRPASGEDAASEVVATRRDYFSTETKLRTRAK